MKNETINEATRWGEKLCDRVGRRGCLASVYAVKIVQCIGVITTIYGVNIKTRIIWRFLKSEIFEKIDKIINLYEYINENE